MSRGAGTGRALVGSEAGAPTNAPPHASLSGFPPLHPLSFKKNTVIWFIILGVGRICLLSTGLAQFPWVSEWQSCTRAIFNDSVKPEVWHCAGNYRWQKVYPLIPLLLLHLFLPLSSGRNVPVLFMAWFYNLVKEEEYMCYVTVLACSSSDVNLNVESIFYSLGK